MTSTSQPDTIFSSLLNAPVNQFTKLSYQALQQGKSYFGLAHKIMSTRLLETLFPGKAHQYQPVPPELLDKLQQRQTELLEADWQDAEKGVYPSQVLLENPWDEFFRYYPILVADSMQIKQRINQKEAHQFADQIPTEGYPNYYLQNFHYQTDGYLSEMSANLYDLQVEILFGGTADPMRRRILAPLKAGLDTFKEVSPRQIRILDVACGTGRTLKFLRDSFPLASLYGTDLSPAYLRKANELLSQIPGELPQLMQANAEELPYQDDYFHGISSVFLFHELPAQARQNVINECFRVLKPGGTFVICDSIQMSDSPDFQAMMTGFYETFHEPFYRHYMTDDLTKRLQDAGFEMVEEQVYFMSKYLIGKKPVSVQGGMKEGADRPEYVGQQN